VTWECFAIDSLHDGMLTVTFRLGSVKFLQTLGGQISGKLTLFGLVRSNRESPAPTAVLWPTAAVSTSVRVLRKLSKDLTITKLAVVVNLVIKIVFLWGLLRMWRCQRKGASVNSDYTNP